MVRPASSATTRSRSTASRTSSVRKRPTKDPILRDAARLSGGGAWPLAYLPVSTPWARGDQTTWPTPSRAHSGSTSASMRRRRIEYSGWLDTSRSSPRSSARARASPIWPAVHSLTPT